MLFKASSRLTILEPNPAENPRDMPVKIPAFLAVFLALATSLLLTLALMERFVIAGILIDGATVTEADLRRTYSALKLVVGVLPYTLGVMILGALALSIAQAIQRRGSPLAVTVLVILCGPLFYNIFLADTAAVVAALEATSADDPIDIVGHSLRLAVVQHYVGLGGFATALAVQSTLILRA